MNQDQLNVEDYSNQKSSAVDRQSPTSLPLHPTLLVLGALLFVANFVLMIKGVPPFVTHTYEIAWWSLIAVLDGVIWWRSGRSPMATGPFRFLLLCLWSVALWFLFELINLRLENWYYINVGADTPGRWLGSFVSFATVIPAIYLFAGVLTAFGFFPPGSVDRKRRRIPGWLPPALVVLGVFFLVLPLVWPRSFYPLVWGGLVLILDPLNRRLGGGSLLSELEKRSGRIILLYLAAGLMAGFFWEFLNYWSRVKWIYTVPHLEELKLFEMPVLGFLGFPPFALECWVVVETLSVLGLVPPPGGRPRPRARILLLAAAVLASGLTALVALPAMDRQTFASLYPLVEDLPDLSDSRRRELRDRGIRDCFELEQEFSLEGEEGSDLPRELELILHAGIGIESARALAALGIGSVEDLARSDPAALFERLETLELHRRPNAARVRYWIRKAGRRVDSARFHK